MTINSFCICGAGTMGSGIAQVTATAGYPTVLFDLNETVIENAKQSISKSLRFLVEKGKLDQQSSDEIIKRINFTVNIAECKAGCIIEAIVEKPEAKISLFGQLAAINSPGTVLASNTSSLSISRLAGEIDHPERFAGIHFFNPAQVMKLVEVVKGDQTSDEVVGEIISIIKRLGKTPVVCKDAPGFIVNRVARPYYIESLRLAEEGVSMDVADKLLESKGFRMGPFRLMDLIGNDVNYAVSCSVYEQMDKPERLKPSPIQKEKVEKGELGKKTGKGYYEYKV
jgi:3-hydroxybutyryl-CoA dehydrogenase